MTFSCILSTWRYSSFENIPVNVNAYEMNVFYFIDKSRVHKCIFVSFINSYMIIFISFLFIHKNSISFTIEENNIFEIHLLNEEFEIPSNLDTKLQYKRIFEISLFIHLESLDCTKLSHQI